MNKHNIKVPSWQDNYIALKKPVQGYRMWTWVIYLLSKALQYSIPIITGIITTIAATFK